ncbi:hypothetical protein ACQ4M3_34325 [Leptolyngbya sp. AN03gr2]|uniref:hypothetical protein n=1 Tax=unclassified Leptolyngbya TaxID=2650499 RepID=UPI003D31071A
MLRLISLKTGLGQTVQAQLYLMQQRHVKDFEGFWRSILHELGQDDEFWGWAMKKRLTASDDRFEAYALEFEGLTQGLMWIETQWHRSWVNSVYRIVYIEALASAPWNRRRLEDPPYLDGVGTALLLFARRRSVALGYEGRVGLHALSTSEGFYERRNMTDYGQDPDKEDLRYFEYGRLLQPLED